MANCDHCGKPATCYGSYENLPSSYACDDCCGHGCEDGYCESLIKCEQCGRAEVLDAYDIIYADEGKVFCTNCSCEQIPISIEDKQARD